MKVAILARNYTDEESRRLLTDAGFEILDQPQKELGIGAVAVSGGVSANSALRAGFEEACGKAGVKLYLPPLIYCTDNAAMIGAAAYHEYLSGRRSGYDLNAVPGLKLGER